MPVMNFDLEDGLPPVSFSLKASEAERFVAFMAECDAALKAAPAPAGGHPDDLAVDRFAAAMKAKMAASRAKGRNGWDNPDLCPTGRLQGMLIDHLAKGDPVDIGNFAMMLFNRGEPVAAAPGATEIEPDAYMVVPPEGFPTHVFFQRVNAQMTAGEQGPGSTVVPLVRATASVTAPAGWRELLVELSAMAGSMVNGNRLSRAAKELLDAAPAQGAPSDDARDAARWRAFIGSARIRMLGSAGLVESQPDHYAHFGMEIWTRYGRPGEYDFSKDNALGKIWLTKYADIAIQAQKTRP